MSYGSLSAGQQRRVANPAVGEKAKLWILDEPTSLDVQGVALLQNALLNT